VLHFERMSDLSFVSANRSWMETSAETKACTGGRFDAVLLAASAGGIPAIGTALGGLPADFPAAILVVQHLDPRYKSYLSQILDRRTELEVREATERARVMGDGISGADGSPPAGKRRRHPFPFPFGSGPFRAAVGRSAVQDGGSCLGTEGDRRGDDRRQT
jgi:hypothetical protein